MNEIQDSSTEILPRVAESEAELKSLVASILDEAVRAGADQAEVSASEDCGLGVTVRMGELETVEFNRDQGFGITVYLGTRKGSASTSDSSVGAVRDTVRAALNIAHGAFPGSPDRRARHRCVSECDAARSRSRADRAHVAVESRTRAPGAGGQRGRAGGIARAAR